MLTNSGSRVNGIHFSGFSAWGILRVVRKAEKSMNKELTDLHSSSVALLLSGLRHILSPPGLVFFLRKWATSSQQSSNLIPGLLAVMFLLGLSSPPWGDESCFSYITISSWVNTGGSVWWRRTVLLQVFGFTDTKPLIYLHFPLWGRGFDEG